jgi:hypothetical protein
MALWYVAGEMTAAEEECFEQRLADDQAAREAVAQAVELREAVRLAAAGTMPADRGRVRFAVRRFAGWAAGLAAALLLTGGIWRLTSANRHLPPGNDPTGNGVKELASTGADVARTWAELRHAQDAEPSDPELALPPRDLGGSDFTETEVDVPQWMLTAFAAKAKQD